MELYKCPVCKREVDIEDTDSGVCKGCALEGYWIDPAGGLHSPGPENEPCDEFYYEGSMYE